MAQAAENTEMLEIPDGGIAKFVMSDEEATAAYGPDKDEDDYGEEGIAQLSGMAKQLAEKGREGDDVVAHLQTGELVIPAQLLEENPEMKETIFAFLEGQGVEDPQRYVVGSGQNSVNPDTGAFEFFFKKLKRAFKKVVRSVKKVVKKVVNVVKKVLPSVLPIALSFSPLGAVLGSAVGSGIGTLIQGGSIGDALKSSFLSGATGAIFQGFTGSGGFMENIQNSISDPIGRFQQTFSGAKVDLQNLFGGSQAQAANAGKPGFFSDYVSPVSEAASSANTASVREQAVSPQTTQQATSTEVLRAGDTSALPVNNSGGPVNVTLANGGTQTIPAGGQIPAGATVNPTLAPTVQPYKPPGFMESIKGAIMPGDDISFSQGIRDAFMPAKPTAEQLSQIGSEAYNSTFSNAMQLPGMTESLAAERALAAQNAAVEAASPGFLRTYGPLLGAGLATTAITGGFDPVQPDPLNIVPRDAQGNEITGETLVSQDPNKYLVGDLGPMTLDPNTGQYVPASSYSSGMLEDLSIRRPDYLSYLSPTQYAYRPPGSYLPASPAGGPFERPYQYAAEGGPIFPRRNGGIMPDEGIPGQDSVRAMLMPGEFVMTTDAVRGLGNGDLNSGIKNMYSVMRNLERRGRSMS